MYPSPNVRKAVTNELEFLLRCALNKCVSDGALLTDIVHLYRSANGIDFNYAFNPEGQYAVTLGNILLPSGLHIILDQFAQMIQS